MNGRGLILVALSATVLAACVAARRPSAPEPCDAITGTATFYGRAETLRRAERDFRSRAPDIRGDLVGSGVRRVRIVAQRRVCEPYRIFSAPTGLMTCKVQARVCGR
jgi:hypothetical protein